MQIDPSVNSENTFVPREVNAIRKLFESTKGKIPKLDLAIVEKYCPEAPVDLDLRQTDSLERLEPMASENCKRVKVWLERLNLSHLIPAFRAHKIRAESLVECSEEKEQLLVSLGVGDLRDRATIQSWARDYLHEMEREISRSTPALGHTLEKMWQPGAEESTYRYQSLDHEKVRLFQKSIWQRLEQDHLLKAHQEAHKDTEERRIHVSGYWPEEANANEGDIDEDDETPWGCSAEAECAVLGSCCFCAFLYVQCSSRC
jgi:hypothetical protein